MWTSALCYFLWLLARLTSISPSGSLGDFFFQSVLHRREHLVSNAYPKYQSIRPTKGSEKSWNSSDVKCHSKMEWVILKKIIYAYKHQIFPYSWSLHTFIFRLLGTNPVGICLCSVLLMFPHLASFKLLNYRPGGEGKIIQLQNLRSPDSRKVPSALEPQPSCPSPWETLQLVSFWIAWCPHLPSLADTSTHPALCGF